jgi:hypothetical protein
MARFTSITALPLGFADLPLEYDYIIYPAGTLSILTLIVVSLLGKPSPEAKWRPFWATANAAGKPAAGGSA